MKEENEHEQSNHYSSWKRHSRNYCKGMYLAEHRINILDISQTIVQGYFNMMMIVDISALDSSFGQAAEELEKLGEGIGVSVKIQREEIFTKMHRI